MMGTIIEHEEQLAKESGRRCCDVAMVFKTEGQQLDLRRYNKPSANEVAAIIVSDDAESDIALPSYAAIRLHGNQLTHIDIQGGHVDGMVYPLLFPYGDRSYNRWMKLKNGRKLTMLQYYAYRLSQQSGVFNPIVHAGKLFHQFLVDAYVKIESYRLDFIRHNQQTLRVDTYKGVQDYLAKAATDRKLPPGKPIILPSSFIGSPRSQREHYMDAMAICRKYGKSQCDFNVVYKSAEIIILYDVSYNALSRIVDKKNLKR